MKIAMLKNVLLHLLGRSADKNNPTLSNADAIKRVVEEMSRFPDGELLMFREGRLSGDESLARENFLKGSRRIAKFGQETSPVNGWPVLPLAEQYGSDPGMTTLFQRLLKRLSMSRFLWGRHLIWGPGMIGKPIGTANRPAD